MNVAVIGAGYWGRNIVRNALQNKLIELVVICESNVNAIQKEWISNPKIKLVTSYDEVLIDESILCVFIVTPAHSHYELAKRGIAAGKNIFVEKPITTSYADISVLIRLAKENHVNLFPSHTYLHSTEIEQISKSINGSNSIGWPVLYQSNRSNLGRFRPDVNAAWDLAIHDLYIAQYLFDARPLSVSAFGVRSHINHPETACSLQVEYAGGLHALICVSWLSPAKYRDLVITGTEGAVVFNDCKEVDKITHFDIQLPKDLGHFKYGESIHHHTIAYEPGEAISRQIHEFITISKAGYQGVKKATNAQEIIRILECADISMSSNGSNVKIN